MLLITIIRNILICIYGCSADFTNNWKPHLLSADNIARKYFDKKSSVLQDDLFLTVILFQVQGILYYKQNCHWKEFLNIVICERNMVTL